MAESKKSLSHLSQSGGGRNRHTIASKTTPEKPLMTQNEAPYNPNESDDEEETVSPPGIKRASLPVNVKRALPQAMTIE